MAVRIVSVSVLILFLLPSTSSSGRLTPKIPKDLIEPFTSQTSSHPPVPQVDIGPRVVNIGVGKQQISTILDINTELIWNICVPSNNTSNFYNPSNSSTFSNISCASCPSIVAPNCTGQCNYKNIKIDTWGTYGYLVKDNVVVGVNSTNITFGCVYNVQAYDYNSDDIFGVLGFANASPSLIGQMGYQRFSYCLPPNATEATTVKFGESAKITGENSQSIKMIDHKNGSFYYLNLTLIEVGDSDFPINTSQYYTVIDTYYPYIYLNSALYNTIRDAILYEMGLSVLESDNSIRDLCFNKVLMIPSLKLQFDGGVNVTLEKSSYVVKHSNSTFRCIGIYSTGENGWNILGNLMQVDKNMVFDLENKTLSFEKIKCGSSAALIPSGALCLVVLLFSFLVM